MSTVIFNAGHIQPKQLEFMRAKHRYVGFGGARGGGKMIQVDTPIPTSNGWVRMGDISVGMSVFGRDGKTHKVVDSSSIQERHAWKFVFDDGSELISCDEHLWLTYSSRELAQLHRRTDEFRERRRAMRPSRVSGNKTEAFTKSLRERNAENPPPTKPAPTGTIRTTAEIVATLKVQNGRQNNHAIPVCESLILPEKELPLEPYLLGLWLGDGSKGTGSFTTADGLEKAFVDAGFEVRKWKSKYAYNVIGLVPFLRKIGVLEKKFIPHDYLWASQEQRLSLLQGLMDTDGNCNQDGSCEFTNTNKNLTDGVAFLARSLGMKCTVREGRAKLYGKDCGAKYRVSFMSNQVIFRVERKAEKNVLASRRTTRFRYIVKAEDVGKQIMRCISIDSSDHLYLAGEHLIPTHNSHIVRKKAPSLALEYPGIRILIVRRTFPLLKANHIDFMRADLVGIAKYNQQDKEFTFKNGSKIFFGYCDNDNDAERYQGPEYDIIFLDEASNLREEWIKKIIACNRGANNYPKRMYFTMNPGGESHTYLKRLFVDKRYQDKENPSDYIFIQSLVTDNTALMEMQPDYINALENLPYKLRQAWLFGSWELFEGQFFEQFIDDPAHYKDRRWTHVIEPFPPERNWPIYRSFDWGRAKPFSVGYWTIDYDGIAYRILEMYGIGNEPNEGCKWNPDQVFQEVAKLEQSHPWLKGKDIRGVADPSIWNKETGMSVYDFAVKEGIYFSRADNERIPGWLQCHYRLHFDEDGIPMCYFFKNCEHIIRTIPLMIYHKNKVEDLDTDMEDHAVDEWRYFCMAHPITPSKPVEAKPIIMDPLSGNYNVGKYRRAI